ncbi:hypothetical protein J8273_8825 [Carpediemonas membranifera]|uniref:Uncharacterized protein n=1 Tax=Carpediemonas membranifera TaxID=201153 RepID=A0A8J6B3Y3_9EUKA|nr:hypothetical protein J8273_8825 [Carpediemonas membranifera]|eukprot:KAG9389532.1 hypothetical protein J8273_8825 [Carpediemonas membranifera]
MTAVTIIIITLHALAKKQKQKSSNSTTIASAVALAPAKTRHTKQQQATAHTEDAYEASIIEQSKLVEHAAVGTLIGRVEELDTENTRLKQTVLQLSAHAAEQHASEVYSGPDCCQTCSTHVHKVAELEELLRSTFEGIKVLVSTDLTPIRQATVAAHALHHHPAASDTIEVMAAQCQETHQVRTPLAALVRAYSVSETREHRAVVRALASCCIRLLPLLQQAIEAKVRQAKLLAEHARACEYDSGITSLEEIGAMLADADHCLSTLAAPSRVKREIAACYEDLRHTADCLPRWRVIAHTAESDLTDEIIFISVDQAGLDELVRRMRGGANEGDGNSVDVPEVAAIVSQVELLESNPTRTVGDVVGCLEAVIMLLEVRKSDNCNGETTRTAPPSNATPVLDTSTRHTPTQAQSPPLRRSELSPSPVTQTLANANTPTPQARGDADTESIRRQALIEVIACAKSQLSGRPPIHLTLTTPGRLLADLGGCEADLFVTGVVLSGQDFLSVFDTIAAALPQAVVNSGGVSVKLFLPHCLDISSEAVGIRSGRFLPYLSGLGRFIQLMLLHGLKFPAGMLPDGWIEDLVACADSHTSSATDPSPRTSASSHDRACKFMRAIYGGLTQTRISGMVRSLTADDLQLLLTE